jgi:hypothetical protein
MEREEALENNWRSDLTMAEPHFDDERTIRSAQPVVPLNDVADVAKEQSRRKWMLAGAFVIASLLGSTAALALVRLRQPAPTAVATQSTGVEEAREAPVAQVPETEVVGGETPSETLSIEETELDVEAAEPRTQKPKRHNPATSRRSAAPAPVTVTIQTNPPAGSGEARIVDEWQERRQRRVNRKPQNHHRDLFRIREIFEGPRRNRRLDN